MKGIPLQVIISKMEFAKRVFQLLLECTQVILLLYHSFYHLDEKFSWYSHLLIIDRSKLRDWTLLFILLFLKSRQLHMTHFFSNLLVLCFPFLFSMDSWKSNHLWKILRGKSCLISIWKLLHMHISMSLRMDILNIIHLLEVFLQVTAKKIQVKCLL